MKYVLDMIGDLFTGLLFPQSTPGTGGTRWWEVVVLVCVVIVATIIASGFLVRM